MTKKVIIIPARMAATRLPNKPMADIHGRPMITHVIDRAREAELGEPLVATDSEDIFTAVQAYGARAVMTRSDHASGSDRIFEALHLTDADGAVEVVVNIQGDLPTLDPMTVKRAAELASDPLVDIATVACPIADAAERESPHIVKVVGSPNGPQRLQALYFTRATAPWGDGPLYHHIGLYAFKRQALARFVKLPPSPLEIRERLEQLRALEAGMRIDVAIVEGAPLGVDTPHDLDRARALLA
ncbi:MAG: 3-deoxy-manno-octulosonate cytidylyltransferase [Pseudomonadota bacterium]